MKRLLTVTLVAVAIACATLAIEHRSTQAQTRTYQLTVRNITERQPISPPIVVVHDSNTVLLPSSAGRLDGLEEFAESGAQPNLMESLKARSGVKSVERFGGVIDPQTQQTIISVKAEPGDYISVLAMLMCTNDAVAMGTAILSDVSSPAFGSGVVYDAGTEVNAESRRTVPCLDGEGVSNLDTADGEGRITRHPGIAVIGDLGAVFGWDRTVLEIVVDRQGSQPKPAFEVGATLLNKTRGQPITAPVVVVHDKHVDVVAYQRPKELRGIDKLSESGDGAELLDTLSAMPGVLSVAQWNAAGEIAPGTNYRDNVRAAIGTNVTLLAMLACTNDGYISATAEVSGATNQIQRKSSVATVFDSGSENNDETRETVPCLGGDSAGFSEGVGENQRSEHSGISGNGDLNPATHGWNAQSVATLSLHSKVTATATPTATPEPTREPAPTATPTATSSEQPAEQPTPEPTMATSNTPTPMPEPIGTTPATPTSIGEDGQELPDTGGATFAITTLTAAIMLGFATALIGVMVVRVSRRRRNEG